MVSKYAGKTSIETQAITAAMNGDDEELEKIVDGMGRYELSQLRTAAEMVASECDAKLRGSNRR